MFENLFGKTTKEKPTEGRMFESLFEEKPVSKIVPLITPTEEVISPVMPTREYLPYLPGAIAETFKKAFPGFSDENIKNLAERNEAWEKLPFTKKVKLFGGELGKNLGELIKSFPRDAVQFIATPTIGAIEEITDMSLGEVELPTKIGEWIGPLTGTRTQLEQYQQMGLTEGESKGLVVA